jgi:uncharacterized pyridoxamine 5'-phosphate oxidase family protein
MIENYDKNLLLNFLRNNPIMNIAVVDNNKPMASVVLFAVDDNFTIYFAAHNASFKTKALLKNTKISFSVWKHHTLLVQGDGIATPSLPQQNDVLLDKLALASTNIDDFWPPILSVGDGNYVTFTVVPTWLRILDLKHLKIFEDTDPFINISLK